MNILEGARLWFFRQTSTTEKSGCSSRVRSRAGRRDTHLRSTCPYRCRSKGSCWRIKSRVSIGESGERSSRQRLIRRHSRRSLRNWTRSLVGKCPTRCESHPVAGAAKDYQAASPKLKIREASTAGMRIRTVCFPLSTYRPADQASQSCQPGQLPFWQSPLCSC